VPQKRFAAGPIRYQQQQRAASDNASSKDVPASGANESRLPHVTEEAAAIDKITGGTPPDIQQGTPVQEVSDDTDNDRGRRLFYCCAED
jgi:hypothetical protein